MRNILTIIALTLSVISSAQAEEDPFERLKRVIISYQEDYCAPIVDQVERLLCKGEFEEQVLGVEAVGIKFKAMPILAIGDNFDEEAYKNDLIVDLNTIQAEVEALVKKYLTK